MGASRKLQGEIDRVLKKVQEGVDVFDSIWNKVYDTENANQKEKFEADLKKEIKKLQRYRDQIKTWIQSSEIKDKKALMDARKQIEREMERFKVCEKETKTKAFSKEGLGQQPKTDPREKAKSETRDWLNTTVSDLETQIESFEAEVEGLTIKKGKAKPPRLVHLELSITRHKAHIKKLESILRLLDNDELSPEQVNDVRDFLEDYVERNQDDFDEFSDVEDLYTALPMETVEAIEDLVSSLGPSNLAKGAVPVPAAKSTTATSSVQVTIPPVSQEQGEEVVPQEITSSPVRTPSAKTGQPSSPVPSPSPVATNPSPRGPATSGPAFSRTNPEPASGTTPVSVPVSVPVPVKEDEVSNVPVPNRVKQAPPGMNPSPVAVLVPVSPLPVKTVLTSEGNGTSTGTSTQPLGSPMGKQQQSGAGTDSAGSGATDGAPVSTRMPPVTSGPQTWRPQMMPPVTFPPQSENVVRTRAEIAPDQREQYVQRLQQVQQAKQQQQQQQAASMAPPVSSSTNQKSPIALPPISQSQHNLLMQQAKFFQGLFIRPLGSQSSPNQASKTRQGVTLQAPPENSHSKTDEQAVQQQTNNTEDISPKSIANSDDLKSPRPGSSSMTEGGTGQTLSDLTPGQQMQLQATNSTAPPVNHGVIGRRSAMSTQVEDNFDQVNALQLLEAAFYKLPQPKDSERVKSYVPRHPVVTPASYPQVQSPTVSNPALWERLAYDSLGTDTLFFAFYNQPNTYQQYLAARELKKNSWRYHRKYNTWFQRHEEPKVTTDEFEKGSYVYFDFHVTTDDNTGWCQRVKNEFVFEYNYLEDELAV